MTDKEAFEQLAKFAAARARGATIVFKNGGTLPCDERSGMYMDAESLARYGGIREIIEPPALRDWTKEDAKKHIGKAWRIICNSVSGIIGHSESRGWGAWEENSDAWLSWAGMEYAAPIWGTDPKTWDWKPCKVEVPAPPPVKFDAVATLRALHDDILTGSISHMREINALAPIANRIASIIKALETP